MWAALPGSGQSWVRMQPVSLSPVPCLKAVQMLAVTAQAAEHCLEGGHSYRHIHKAAISSPGNAADAVEAVVAGAAQTALDIGAGLIVVVAASGAAAVLLARYRMGLPVLLVTAAAEVRSFPAASAGFTCRCCFLTLLHARPALAAGHRCCRGGITTCCNRFAFLAAWAAAVIASTLGWPAPAAGPCCCRGVYPCAAGESSHCVLCCGIHQMVLSAACLCVPLHLVTIDGFTCCNKCAVGPVVQHKDLGLGTADNRERCSLDI